MSCCANSVELTLLLDYSPKNFWHVHILYRSCTHSHLLCHLSLFPHSFSHFCSVNIFIYRLLWYNYSPSLILSHLSHSLLLASELYNCHVILQVWYTLSVSVFFVVVNDFLPPPPHCCFMGRSKSVKGRAVWYSFLGSPAMCCNTLQVYKYTLSMSILGNALPKSHLCWLALAHTDKT